MSIRTGEPAAPVPAVGIGGCCDSPPRTARHPPEPAAAPCCGTEADANAEDSCCGSTARAHAVAADQGCCR
jgi:hypothetical protein